MGNISHEQVLILAILLFLAVLALGCFCMLTIPTMNGGPAFVI